MKSLIIYAHPWDGSFNNHVLKEVEKSLVKQEKEVTIIDLNKEGFNPVLTKEDLKVFSQGKYHDKLAASYAEKLKVADELILIFPIWWYGEPAILKGFYDKVFLKGHAYELVGYDLKGLLNNIKNATIITTASIDKKIFSYLGDPIKNTLAGGVLKMIGIENYNWIHCATVHLETARHEFIKEIKNYFK